MPFPTLIKSEALIACGRCCCICHKFCGTKMECNHIIPEAAGGFDTSDNCVPLCFDCHTDVGHYNPRHPKGNKYTPMELRGHRDRWYEKVKATAGLVESRERQEVDRQVFSHIRKLLPSDPTIVFLRTENFAGYSFKLALLDPLHDFEHWASLPDSEFLDADLEALRSHLYHAVREFTSELVGNIFSIGDGNWASVPENWSETNPKRFDEVVKKIHSCAAAVCVAYDEMIRLGRKKLDVA